MQWSYIFGLLFAAGTMFPITTNGQHRPVIKSLVDSIAVSNTYTGVLRSLTGFVPKQWKWFDSLRKMGTDSELLELMRHKSLAVRCYSYQALVERENDNAFPILLQHITDIELINVEEGCCVGKEVMKERLTGIYMTRDRYIKEAKKYLLP